MAAKPHKIVSKARLVPKEGKVPKRTKKSTRGKITPSKLKKELDRVVSLYIRRKYPTYCYTCNKPSDKLQCGHFVPRIYLATRWEEDNLRPQCVGCNIWGRGQLLDFEENLKAEIGTKRVEELKQQRNQILKLKPDWYLEQIEIYQKKLAEL